MPRSATITAEEQAERLETAITDAREVLREIRSASKDLRALLKDARTTIETDIATRMENEVRRQIKELAEQNVVAMRRASDKVISEFDKLGTVLLGVDRGETLEDIVRKVAAMPGRRQVEAYQDNSTIDHDVLGVLEPEESEC